MEEPVTATVTNPWEQRATLGTFPALLQTVRQSLLAPGEFFAGTPATGGLEAPLWYGGIVATAGIVIGQLWNLVANLATTGIAAATAGDDAMPGALIQGGMNIGVAAVLIVCSPIFAVIGLFIGTAFLHLALLIFGGARSGFEATFRSVAYAQGPMLLAIVPFIGPLVGGIWALVLEIFALMHLHRIEGWRAAVAALFFPCLCTILVGALVAAFGAAIVALIADGGNFTELLHRLPR
ncbi:MAG TPA: YIP1 family protein [bacterium]|nr:YIP1 family protein [bacterium]